MLFTYIERVNLVSYLEMRSKGVDYLEIVIMLVDNVYIEQVREDGFSILGGKFTIELAENIMPRLEVEF